MKDILAKRIFWVILGVVCLCIILVYVFVVWRIAQSNENTRTEIDKEVKTLQSYASSEKKGLKNDTWINAYEIRKKSVDNEVQQCEDYLKQNLHKIKALFTDDSGREITDPAEWKDRYNTERQNLLSRLKEAGVRASAESFDLRDFGRTSPTKEDIMGKRTEKGVSQPGAQEEFWLEDAIVGCVLDTHGAAPAKAGTEEKSKAGERRRRSQARSAVVRLLKIALERPSAAAASALAEGAPVAAAEEMAAYTLVEPDNPMYLVIPFTVTVDLDWQLAPLFVRNLETSYWRYPRLVSASRPAIQSSSSSSDRFITILPSSTMVSRGVPGSTVSWYSETWSGHPSLSTDKSACTSLTVWPGMPVMKSRLRSPSHLCFTKSNAARACSRVA